MKHLCRIGREWIFDTVDYIGYRILEEIVGDKAKIEKAFEIKDNEVVYMIPVPVGVVRKALHLKRLKESGKLNELSNGN